MKDSTSMQQSLTYLGEPKNYLFSPIKNRIIFFFLVVGYVKLRVNFVNIEVIEVIEQQIFFFLNNHRTIDENRIISRKIQRACNTVFPPKAFSNQRHVKASDGCFVVGEPKPFWRADTEKDRWQRQLQLLIDTSKSNVSLGQPLSRRSSIFLSFVKLPFGLGFHVSTWPYLFLFFCFPLLSTGLLAPDFASVFCNNDNVKL